jgi:hypothetical protein
MSIDACVKRLKIMEEISHYLDNYSLQILYILLSFLVLFLVTWIGIWIYNKRKFQSLSHQIPAGVVKNYLDTIIQNSNSLKSSLFRGGGLDSLDPINMPTPSVVSTETIHAAPQEIEIATGDSGELLNQKNAEIAALRQQLAEKTGQVSELDNRLKDTEGQINVREDKIKQLEEKLNNASSGEAPATPADSGSSDADKARIKELEDELDGLKKEKEEIEERLQEYEIIEDDLANLKHLQQENEQLKKTLEQYKAGGAPAPEAGASEGGEEAPDSGDKPAAGPAEEEGGDQSADDLLNEFEKMLG